MSNRAERRARVKALKGRSTRRNNGKVSVEENMRRSMQRGDGVVVHGICRNCSRRTYLINPARYCAPCLSEKIEPTPEMQLQAIHDMDACMECNGSGVADGDCLCTCHEENDDPRH